MEDGYPYRRRTPPLKSRKAPRQVPLRWCGNVANLIDMQTVQTSHSTQSSGEGGRLPGSILPSSGSWLGPCVDDVSILLYLLHSCLLLDLSYSGTSLPSWRFDISSAASTGSSGVFSLTPRRVLGREEDCLAPSFHPREAGWAPARMMFQSCFRASLNSRLLLDLSYSGTRLPSIFQQTRFLLQRVNVSWLRYGLATAAFAALLQTLELRARPPNPVRQPCGQCSSSSRCWAPGQASPAHLQYEVALPNVAAAAPARRNLACSAQTVSLWSRASVQSSKPPTQPPSLPERGPRKQTILTLSPADMRGARSCTARISSVRPAKASVRPPTQVA